MNIDSKIDGNKLIVTVDLSGKRYQSKAALEKAVKQGVDAAKVPATMVASTGGFQRQGGVKFSLNVMDA